MYVYPSTESKTRARSAPYLSIVIGLTTLLCHGLLFRPMQTEYKENRVIAWNALNEALDWEVEQNNLKHELALDAQENPIILEKDPELKQFIQDGTQRKYNIFRSIVPPHESLLKQTLPKRALVLWSPDNTWILLAAVLSLIMIGFTLEHLYAMPVLLVVYLGTGACYLFGQSYLPTPFQTPPHMYWSHMFAVMILLSWLVAPSTVVTIMARGWAFSSFKKTFGVPAVGVALCFSLVWVAISTFPFTESNIHFESFALAPGLALAWAILLKLVPNKMQKEDRDPTVIVNTGLARAELLYGEDRVEEARALLEDLINGGASTDQILRIGDLAWKFDHVALAEKSYQIALRAVLPSRDYHQIAPIMEKMVFRALPLSISTLNSGIELGLNQGHDGHVRKFLTHFKDHPQVQDEHLQNVFGMIVDKEISLNNPDEPFLADIFGWFEHNEALEELTSRIKAFLMSRKKEDSSFRNYQSSHQIHRHVDIELLGVTSTKVKLKIKQQQTQDVPWTAIIALYGAHILGKERGYRGSVVLKFKRRIFACHYSGSEIAIYDDRGETKTFEETWKLFEQQVPEDMPFLPFAQFKDYVSIDLYQKEIQEFLDHSFQ